MNVKEIFEKAEEGTLTYEQFKTLSKDAKFVDLNEGAYVSKKKYNDDLDAKTAEIETLNNTISSRDNDLSDLKKQLEEAGTDAEKLSTLSSDLSALQSKYDEDVKNYQSQLSKQAYEFAVKEFAATKNFTSNAAKRDFINSMVAKELKMDGGKILGAEDFVSSYSEDNEDAFVVEREEEPEPQKPRPTFVSPTQGEYEPTDATGGFADAFHFVGVRDEE